MPKAPQSEFVIEPFDRKKHDRTAFSCEHEALTTYIQRQANQDIKNRVAAVFVLTPDSKTIAGFYTLSQYAVESGSLPEETMRSLGLPRYKELPATLIGRLARGADFKGQGVGEILLVSALEQALRQSKTIASMSVVVDAKDDLAQTFYKRYGFLELPDHPNRLFIPMKTVEQMFAAGDDRRAQSGPS